jgi:hypothetical protein
MVGTPTVVFLECKNGCRNDPSFAFSVSHQKRHHVFR